MSHLLPRPPAPIAAGDRLADVRASDVLARTRDAYVRLDREFQFLAVNSAAERALGKGSQELLGRTHWEVFPAAVGTPVEAAYRRVAAEGGEAHLTHHYVGEGYDVHLEIDAYGTTPAGGGPGEVDVFWRDVSARVRAEAALAERERQLRTMLDAIPTLAWTARADGYIDWYNARWYEYTGTTPEQMEGWGWQRVHDPAVLPAVLERWQASIGTGRPFAMTFPLRGADGVRRDFLTRVAPVHDAQGQVTRWFGTNTDLTTEREAAAERERLLVESEAARAELTTANAQLQEAGLELELSNQQLQEQAAELEATTEELQATAAHLEEQVEAADQARAELAASEAKFRSVMEGMTEGVMIFDADGTVVYHNPASQRLHGVATEAEGRFRRDDRPVTWRGFDRDGAPLPFAAWPVARVLRGERVAGQVLHAERVEGGRPTGHAFDASYNGAPVTDAAGRFAFGFITIRDTGDALRAERALAAREATLRSFTESAPVLMGLVELLPHAAPDGGDDFLHVYDNPATERFLGVAPGATTGRRTTALGAPRAMRDAWGRAYREAGARGAPVHFEYAYGTDSPDAPDGARWLAVTVAPVGGPPVGDLPAGGHAGPGAPGPRFSYVAEDVTASRRAEAALAAERAMLRAVLAQMPVGVAVAEAPSGAFLLANAIGERLLGHPLGPSLDAGAYGALGALHDDGTPYAPGEYPAARALAGETVDQHVMRYRRGDGTVTYLAVSAAPVYDAGADGAPGRLVRTVTAWTDVGERVALEAALRRARDAAEAANQTKGQFLANMSHELRTPLNAIGGYAQLLDMGLHGPVTDDQRGALGRIQTAQTRLLSLINDILNYAKLESGRVEYDVRPVDVRDVVREVAPLVEPQLRAKGLLFELATPETPCVVWADGEKLGQVLVNLLSNAVKFTDSPDPRTGAPGRVTVSVAVRDAGPDGGQPELAFVRVGDTGRGIPRAKQDAIFEPFVQVRTRDSSYAHATEGTGLGLAISRDLARGMGGDLRVRSTEDEGSTFTVALRRVVDAGGHPTDRRTGDERRDEERRADEDRRHETAGDAGGPPAGAA